jgi:hypothetical protein
MATATAERLHVAGDVPERQTHGLYVGFIYGSRRFPQGEQKHHKAEYHDDSDDCLHIDVNASEEDCYDSKIHTFERSM